MYRVCIQHVSHALCVSLCTRYMCDTWIHAIHTTIRASPQPKFGIQSDTTEYICDTYCQCIPYESDMYSMFVSYVRDTIHTWFAWNTLTIRIHVRYIIQSIPGYMYSTCILRTYYAYLIPYHLIPPIKVCLGWRRYRTRWKRWKGPRQLGCRSPHCWRWSSSWRQYVFQYVFHMYSCTDLELEVEIHMDTKEYMWIHDDTPRYTGCIQNT